jgi:hypothetical protein
VTSKAANDFNDDGCKAMADVADLSEELVQHCLVSCDFFYIGASSFLGNGYGLHIRANTVL